MVVAILFGLIVVLAYFLNKHLFSFWSNHGVKQLDPSIIVGDAGPLFAAKKSMGEYFADLYNKHKDQKLLGIYMTYRPVAIVNDPKLVQDIMIRDFTSFHDRPMPSDPENDPLSGHLFNLPGQQWRDLRVKMSPTFTSGKLKGMFSIIQGCGKTLDDYLEKNVKNGVDAFDFRDLMARFNTNIISSVAFGIDNDCINEPDHMFRKMGEKIFEMNFWNGIKALITFLLPNLFYKLKLKMTSPEVEDFIFTIVKQTVEYREKNNFSRNDFMQLLIQLKNQGFVAADKGEKESGNVKDGAITKLNMKQLAAQTFVFFVAGFETSSSTMSFCLFELARHPKMQKKIQDEIDRVLKSSNEGLSYDSLSEMKYIECCIDEALRKYPIVPVHLRVATRDYKVADSNMTIPKGTAVFIPVLGHHRDPAIYENPMEFKPERFADSPHGNGTSEGLFYTPFGDGPRNCIGMRLGKLTTKIGIALILSKYNLELVDKSLVTNELEFDPKQFGLTPSKIIQIKITPR